MRLVFDIETTLIPDDPRAFPDKLWCGVAQNYDLWLEGKGEGLGIWLQDEMDQFVRYLERADLLVGHNIAKFDLPVLEHHFPDAHFTDNIVDTLAVSRMAHFATIMGRSIAFQRSVGRDKDAQEAAMPSRLLGRHSLESWGYRLQCAKKFADVDPKVFFSQYSEDMLERCISDVRLNAKLFHYLETTGASFTEVERTEPSKVEPGKLRRYVERVPWPAPSWVSMVNESKVSRVIDKQERNGVGFDEASAVKLYAELIDRREALLKSLAAQIPGWFAPDGPKAGMVIPKRSRTMKPGTSTNPNPWPVTYEESAPYTKVKWVEFNPLSGQHRAKILTERFGWVPTEYTDAGQAKTSEEILASLDYPIIPELLEVMMVEKRCGQVAEGNQGWLKQVTAAGRIHGSVWVTGTRTSRMSHTRPNMAQVPKVGSQYGAECRALFRPTREGWIQVGADASGLELRMLAHRLAHYDEGAFATELLEGDPHSAWQAITGLWSRDKQKTLTYALLYGAGDTKLGTIVIDDWRGAYEAGETDRPAPQLPYAMELGKAVRGKLLHGIPALDYLIDAVHGAYARGYVIGLDGRIIPCKSEHGALNDLLQSDGAIVMKHALVRFDEAVRSLHGPHGTKWAYMLNVHDEWQLETIPEVADEIGELMVASIVVAGQELDLRLPLDGEYKVGPSWEATH